VVPECPRTTIEFGYLVDRGTAETEGGADDEAGDEVAGGAGEPLPVGVEHAVTPMRTTTAVDARSTRERNELPRRSAPGICDPIQTTSMFPLVSAQPATAKSGLSMSHLCRPPNSPGPLTSAVRVIVPVRG
jgi:hypothetical protein